MLQSFGLSDPGCVRTNNEDFYLVERELGLYLVADGMGGAQAGEHASRLAAETVRDFIRESGQPNAEVLKDAIEQANKRVLAEAEKDPNLHGMGTTITAAIKVGNDLLFANVGDSRAYVFENEQLHAITEDQTWVNEVGRRLGINEDQLKVHPMRHVLTMAIGVGESLRVQSYKVPLVTGLQFLLCSDGLHGVIPLEMIAETLSTAEPLETKCRTLVNAARTAGGPDNITAVLLTVSGDNSNDPAFKASF